MESNVITHIGHEREENQDSYYVNDEAGLYIVADGMGGHLGGKMASYMATEIISTKIIESDDPNIIDAIKNAIFTANYQIYSKAQEDSDYRGMGTTVVVANIRDNQLVVAYIGDSRCYLINEGGMTRLTDDHSFVGELLRNGNITEEEAKEHPAKNILTKALGIDEYIEPDIINIAINDDDMILLCTDGFYNMLKISEIEMKICGEDGLSELLNAALDHGGTDNITAILLKNNK